MRNVYAMGPVCPVLQPHLFSAFWALRLMEEFKYFTNVAWQWDTHPLLFVLWDINMGSMCLQSRVPWTYLLHGLHMELNTGSSSCEPWSCCGIFCRHVEQVGAKYESCSSYILFLVFYSSKSLSSDKNLLCLSRLIFDSCQRHWGHERQPLYPMIELALCLLRFLRNFQIMCFW